MKSLMICFVLSVAAVGPVSAELSESTRDWAEGPVRFLLTDGERAAWEAVADDPSAEDFIALFWARRDPDLSTRVNEFRLAFDSRVEAADREFGEEGLRGALTVRGKTLILLGMPAEVDQGTIGDYLSSLYRTRAPERSRDPNVDEWTEMYGVGFNLNQGRANVWTYTRDQVPPDVEWPSKDERLPFAFFDVEGDGIYRLQSGIRKAADAAAVLNAMPAALIVHPDLDAVPVFGLIPNVPPATPEGLALLDSDPLVEGAVADAQRGAAGPGVNLAWVGIRLPSDAPVGDRVIGRLSRGDAVMGSFRIDLEAREGALGRSYEVAVPVPSGPSKLEVAVAGPSGAIHGETFDLDFEGDAETFMTGAFAGVAGERRVDANVGDPFVFGGYHLDVRPAGRYLDGEDLSVFCVLVLPDSPEAVRMGTVRMRWYVDGKGTPLQPSQPCQLAPSGAGTWVWGTQLPLGNLPREHRYELKVTLKDTDSGVSSNTKFPVELDSD